jgi:dienelactone hydrolase
MCHPELPPGAREPNVRTEEVAVRASDGTSMPALLAIPERTPAPGVVIVNDVFGRSPFYEDLARRLARAGFVALDPELFAREGPLAEQTREAAFARAGRLDQTRAVADLGAAVEWLRAERRVSDAIGVIGFCMGGTIALDLAVRPDVGAVVSYYGFPKLKTKTPLSPPEPLAIVERMCSPILGHWGDQDQGVGLENVYAFRDTLAAAHVAHEVHIYPGLGHGFLRAYQDPSAAGYEAACSSWVRTLDFFRSRLHLRA